MKPLETSRNHPLFFKTQLKLANYSQEYYEVPCHVLGPIQVQNLKLLQLPKSWFNELLNEANFNGAIGILKFWFSATCFSANVRPKL